MILKEQIEHYRNLMKLSDSFLTAGKGEDFLQELIWIQIMLDRAKVVVSFLAEDEKDREASLGFTKEVYEYLDTTLRPRIDTTIEKMSEEERVALTQSFAQKFTYS